MFFGLAAIALIVLIASTLSVVPETKQGVVLRFGQPIKIINRYKPGETFGNTGAGLVAVLPFADQVVWIDKRVRDVDMERQQVLSTDQLRLNIDAFARFRVVDPLRMVITARTEDNVADALRPILGSTCGSRKPIFPKGRRSIRHTSGCGPHDSRKRARSRRKA